MMALEDKKNEEGRKCEIKRVGIKQKSTGCCCERRKKGEEEQEKAEEEEDREMDG